MPTPETRPPVFAGQFYPESAEALKREIGGLAGEPVQAKEDAIACLLPHAGYQYSGSVAARTVAGIDIKNEVILLGPNHTGYGKNLSIMTEGTWQTPLGKLKINSALAAEILRKAPCLEENNLAHESEHSLEVELPILQYFRKSFRIVPIVFMFEEREALKETGEGIAQAVISTGLKNSVLIVASSDMTHYEPQPRAEKNDRYAIEALLALDEERLFDVVERFNISMCGAVPAYVMIVCAKALGATKAKLIKYQTSGDITKDNDSVVGYAGITIS